jgi:dTDP-4-amino-4,6-dideoxygalactose transaminase
MAMRAVVERADAGRGLQIGRAGRRYALMPSFTFAAAALAADWAGLTPLFCDIAESDWAASEEAEEALIARHGDDIAVIVPYATFGNCIDLGRYERLSARTGIPVVVDAAASLGSLDASGKAFAAGCPFPVVFSMHATKTFSTGEGGVIHSTDLDLIRDLRVMGNFGFGAPRSVTTAGLNSKLSEIGALLALARLRELEGIVVHRENLARLYHASLPGWVFQEMRGVRCAYQFLPLLLPPEFEGRRDGILAELQENGVGAAAYFAPHVAEHPFFRLRAVSGDLTVTDRISKRILSLPIWDEMTSEMVATVCNTLLKVCRPHMSVPAHVSSAFLPVVPSQGIIDRSGRVQAS